MSQRLWTDWYNTLNYGDIVEPRGEPTKEVTFFQSEVIQPFDWFEERELNLDYIRREFQWYLGGDLSDLRICEHASIWRGCVNRDRTLSSNYGHYLFTQGGLKKAVQLLKNDRHSRRAVISIYNQKAHSKPGIKDIPCTCSITFLIRGTENMPLLHMGVHMRSNDMIFGLGNDAPCFHWFHRLAFWLLKPTYPGLEMGRYVHRADSMHVYERHWNMVREVAFGRGSWAPEIIPDIVSTHDAESLIAGDRTRSVFNGWLYGVEL